DLRWVGPRVPAPALDHRDLAAGLVIAAQDAAGDSVAGGGGAGVDHEVGQARVADLGDGDVVRGQDGVPCVDRVLDPRLLVGREKAAGIVDVDGQVAGEQGVGDAGGVARAVSPGRDLGEADVAAQVEHPDDQRILELGVPTQGQHGARGIDQPGET